ncbi:ankyrin repeat domain-containing protein 50 [Microdochium nivale]|nr:ankyrin repeat domain-containing protein 50 [Microdochium nivale]
MEALAALSLACNVLQLVGVSLKASKALKSIRDEHQPDSGVKSHADILRHLSHEVTQCIATQGSSGNATLCSRAAEVVAIAEELEKLLLRFTTGKKNKFRDGFAYVRKQGDIKALEQRLQRAQDALQSTVLLDVWRNVHSQWDIIKVTFPSFTSELQTLVSELRRGNTDILDIIDKQNTSLRVLNGIKLDVRHISNNLNRQEVECRRDSKLEEFVASLYFPSMNARRNMQSIVAAEGTFQWVLESFNQSRHEITTNCWSDQRVRTASMLELWLGNPDQRLFWISGKPGSGKSTLMHFLADKIPERFNAAPGGCDDASPMMISAFIWASGDELQKSMKGLLCTLLRQILIQSSRLAKAALQVQKPSAKKVSVSDWSEAELLYTLAGAVESLQGPVYIFIDGLDEICSEDGSPERLIDLVRSLSTQGNVKLCVSSRPEILWERALQHYPHLRLQDLTRGDMEHHARQELANALESKPESTQWKHNTEDVLRHLVDNAEGVFLWLHLVIQSLKAGITNDDSWELLWERIDELPVGLESLYEKMVSRLERENKSYRAFAAIVFALVLTDDRFAMKRWNAELEMDHVLSITLYLDTDLRQRVIEADDGIDESLKQEVVCGAERVFKQIRARCAGLVEATLGDDHATLDLAEKLGGLEYRQVAFVHRTVRDFMLEAGRRLWQDAMPPDFSIFCLEVQLATSWIFVGSITPVGLWDPPPDWDELDLELLRWCDYIDAELPGNPREAVFEHLAQLMMAKGIWSRDERNPCVLAATSTVDIEPPRRWLASWAPSGMTTADFADHLLVVSLSRPESPSSTTVRWLCESGANPARHVLACWPGTNWPSAFAMAMSYIAIHPGRCAETFRAMMQFDIDFEEQLTVIYQRRGDCGFALNRHTPSLIASCYYHTQHHIQRMTNHLRRHRPVLQLRIPAFLWLTLGDIEDPKYAEEMKMLFADRIRQCSSITVLKIQLLGFVSVARGSNPSDNYTVSIINGGHKIGRELVLTPDALDPMASQRAIDECHAEIEAILLASLQDPLLTRMDSRETIDWLLASGLAEDMRDKYYERLAIRGSDFKWDPEAQ